MTSNIFTSPTGGTVTVVENGHGNPIIRVADGYVPVIGDTRQAGLDAQNVVPFIASVVKNSQLARPIIKKFIADAGKETVVVINDGVEARVYVPTNEATARRNLAMTLANLEAHRQWTSGEAQTRAKENAARELQAAKEAKEAAALANSLVKFDSKALDGYNAFYGTHYLGWSDAANGSGIRASTIERWRQRAKAAHDKLRTGPDAEAGLAEYIETLGAAWARKYKTWDDVNGGGGAGDKTVKFHIQKAKDKAADTAAASKRNDAGLVYYNAQQGTKFGSWADTDLTDPAFIEQWAALAETASKIIAPTNRITFNVSPSSRTHSPLGFEPIAPAMQAPQYLNW